MLFGVLGVDFGVLILGFGLGVGLVWVVLCTYRLISLVSSLGGFVWVWVWLFCFGFAC